MYTCVVCGYDGLEWPQFLENNKPNFVICDCCGFQSGYDDDDRGLTFDDYRKWWIEQGAPWADSSKKPKGWDLRKQLANIGVKI